MAAGAKEEREDGLAGDLARHLPHQPDRHHYHQLLSVDTQRSRLPRHQPRQLRRLCCRVSVHHEMSSIFCRRTFAGKQLMFQRWIQILGPMNMNLSEKTSFNSIEELNVGRIIAIYI